MKKNFDQTEQKLLSLLMGAEKRWPEIGAKGWTERLEFYAYASKLLELMFTEVKDCVLSLSEDNEWKTEVGTTIDSAYKQAELRLDEIHA